MESLRLRKEFMHKVAEKNNLEDVNWEERKINQFWCIHDPYFECDCGMPVRFDIKSFPENGKQVRQCSFCHRVIEITLKVKTTDQGIKPP